MSEADSRGKKVSASEEQAPVHGVVMRAADGNLYFIPYDKLQPFRVPEAGNDLMSETLSTGAQAAPVAAAHASLPRHWFNRALPLCAIGNNDH